MLSSEEIPINDLNFDRYEAQINKIGKQSGALQKFAIDTLEQGYKDLAVSQEKTLEVLSQQSNLVRVMTESKQRESRLDGLLS